MLVAVGVIVRMGVWMMVVIPMVAPVMLVKELIRKRVIFGERFVVAMLMPATVRPAFRLERREFLFHRHAKLEQHLFQNGIGLNL
jgi:hypothetical protein